MWEVLERINQYESTFNKGTTTKIANFVLKVKNYGELVKRGLPADEIAEEIGKNSGLFPELAKDKTPEGVSRYENIQELISSISDFAERNKEEDPSLENFLSDIALITDADTQANDNEPSISLMTIHQAKGLEFPYVFIVGLEENLFPNIMTLTSRTDLEEERRLFYVALTRAEKRLYLTYCQTRYKWGKLNENEPSRFIDEIDDKYLHFEVPEFSPFEGPRLFGAPTPTTTQKAKPPITNNKYMSANKKEETQSA